MILILLFQNILTIYAEKELICACFKIDEGQKPNLRICFDSNLPFVPKMFRMNIAVRENIGGDPIQLSDEETHILRLTDESCIDEFEYEVPWSSQPSQTIDVFFSWGECPVAFLENFRLVVLPDFTESIHILDGLMEHCRMIIKLKPEIFDELATLPEYKTPEKIDWHPERRDIIPGQTYCVSFFTLEFKNVLVFEQDSIEELIAYEFYKFSLGASFKLYGLLEANTAYLSRIYPCEESEYIDKKLKILTDPKAKYIIIAFTVAHLKREFRNIYKLYRKTTKIIGSHKFSFSDLVIEARKLEQNLTYMDDAILLYFHKLVFISIFFKLPGNTISAKISGVEKCIRGDNILHQRFHIVDMSTAELKVFKIKIGSKSDFERCFSGEQLQGLRRDLSYQ